MPRTFTWFESRRRPPTEYEELTVGLHWGEDCLVGTDLGTWSADSTRLTGVVWEDFRDPAQLHYRTYVARQASAERELRSVLDQARAGGFVDDLDPAWRAAVGTLLGGGAFAEWGVALAMEHVQRFCLSSTLAQSAQLQVCDEFRHAQHGLAWSDTVLGTAGDDDRARAAWMEHPALQPLRRCVERLLVLADWGEVIVAAGLLLEGLSQPFLRELCTVGGRTHRDLATACLGAQAWADEERHLDWCEEFARLALAGDRTNQAVLQAWCSEHLAPAADAVAALAAAFPLGGLSAAALDVARTELGKRLDGLGLQH